MGVPGLLPYVKKACYQGDLSEFGGKTLVVDISCLLHRGVFGCAGKLASGQDTQFYIGYVNKYIKFLLSQKCHLILVFDGRPLPAKKDINDSRRENRQKYQLLGEQLMNQGLTTEAHKAFGRGSTLTREIIEKTIRTFSKVENVDILVAPYEADAQIAYLMQEGYAHAAVTEDSDLIVFGCEKIIFKMDLGTGYCVVYDKKRLPNCFCPVLRRRFDFTTFRRICILAGCDYLRGGLQGVGLKSAEEVFTKASRTDPKILLPRLSLYLNKRIKIDSNFVEDYIKAENTFLHQVVFDPLRREQRPLNSYPNSPDKENQESPQQNKKTKSAKFSYAGEIVSPQLALRLALGNVVLNSSTLEDEFSLPIKIPDWSLWHTQYKKVLEKEKELKEKSLDNKFGAFRPVKSPVKRSAASLVFEDDQLREADDLSVAKRRRFSQLQVGSCAPKNGVYIAWNCHDWMQIYGDDIKKHEENLAMIANASGPECSKNGISTDSRDQDSCLISQGSVKPGIYGRNSI